jgi:glutathione synthase/RimK-type ligase-like ATP-grasp enzyme
MNNKLIDKFKKFVPSFIRKKIRKNISLIDYNIHISKKNNPYYLDESKVIFNNTLPKVGIIKEFYQYHKSYIAACHDLKISYVLIDISKNNWVEQINSSGCEIFLCWPSSGMTEWKYMYDDRIKLIEEDLGKIVYPESKSLWLYENKMRTSEWLKINHLPSPNHWIFYNQTNALNFAESCNLPIVYKTNIGASGSGVVIVKDRSLLRKIIKKAFTKGIVPSRYHPMDRDLGKVFLQEYIEDTEEWRMIRIDNSYFGYRKEKVGDYHSGSKAWSWLDPGIELLDLTKKVTDIGGFTSMDVDIFKDSNGKLYVNELQAVFGATTPAEMLKIDGVEGRYIRHNNTWKFEVGSFSKNQCSNLRLQSVLKKLEKK